jgi:hypothetical protein
MGEDGHRRFIPISLTVRNECPMDLISSSPPGEGGVCGVVLRWRQEVLIEFLDIHGKAK